MTPELLARLLDLVTQTLQLLAQREDGAGEGCVACRGLGDCRDRSTVGVHCCRCLSDRRDSDHVLQLLREISVHDDSSAGGGAATPTPPTVEALRLPGDDSRPEARDGGAA